MKLKAILVLLIACLITAGNVAANTYTCEEAVIGTCKHYHHGDGSGEGIEVETNPPKFDWCIVTRGGVTCDIDAFDCPAHYPGDGHDAPGVAYCEGCGEKSPGPFSVNEAKCCLAYGQPTNPNTGGTHC